MREKLYRAYSILRKGSKKKLDVLSRELGFIKFEDFNSEFERYFAVAPKTYTDIMRNVGL
jgi:transcriptional regulator GlxA family with amidase domain